MTNIIQLELLKILSYLHLKIDHCTSIDDMVHYAYITETTGPGNDVIKLTCIFCADSMNS